MSLVSFVAELDSKFGGPSKPGGYQLATGGALPIPIGPTLSLLVQKTAKICRHTTPPGRGAQPLSLLVPRVDMMNGKLVPGS